MSFCPSFPESNVINLSFRDSVDSRTVVKFLFVGTLGHIVVHQIAGTDHIAGHPKKNLTLERFGRNSK
jgi:hypothetical protein